ncbi:MAG: UDP-N-acetylmuramoyl-L-alanine--D-glutamate ligase [Bacteroidota bacterium]|nr:UDP-N-acetylmuramoyl-L-alanine--D-glutamate ligase [Bacteroidota bacterium]
MFSAENIVVLGAGKSGVGAAVLAQKKGKNVFVSDASSITLEYKSILNNYDIKWEENGHSDYILDKAESVIISPGIPPSSPFVQKISSLGIPIISEIEFAYHYCNSKKICVTGSNGKTTTTLLITHLLNNAGLSAKAVGNVGESYAMSVAIDPPDYQVIELSSFQLDFMFSFKADIALLLNITPDHLDRYENSFDLYVNSKFRITQNMTVNDHFIYNYDDPVIKEALTKRNLDCQTHPVSIFQKDGVDSWLDKESIIIKINNQKQTIMSIHQLAQQGKHNVFNSMAAGIAAKVLDIRKEIIRDSLSDFQNVEHRLEKVAKIHGIDFINDSKATNVNATWYALESMQKPTIWIVGGVDKGNDYSSLKGLVKQKVLGIICLGKENNKIQEEFGEIVSPIYEAQSASQAVQISYRIAKKGYAVLLSPACASFDLFKNYEDRGHQFKKAVRSL